MLLAENDISDVVSAVRAILDSSTVNQERQRCTQKIEELKEGDPGKSVPIAFKLVNQASDVSHVGWNIIEHVIRYKWNDMPADIRVTIRNGVLQYMSEGRYSLTSENLPTKTFVSRNLVAMMEQEWPQNWPELFEQFKSIILDETLHAQAQMVFIVLRRLIENVITFSNVSNVLRRKELSTAVNIIMPEMLAVTIARIKMCIDAGNNDNSILVAKFAIELLSESVDWVVGRVLEETVDKMIEVLCAYLQVANHGIFETAATCLFKIASRKRAKTDETPIVLSMFKDSSMQSIISAASLAAGVSSSSADHYKYLKALCDLLTALGIHLSEIWVYVKNPPPNFSLYLTAIYSFFTHPSMCIRSDVSQVLVTFASHDQISKTKEFVAAVKQVIPHIPKNVEKLGSLDDRTSMTSYYARMDCEDDVEFQRDYIQLRDRILRFVRETLNTTHIEQYLQQLCEWINRVILQNDSIPASEWESLKRYLMAFISTAYQKELVNDDVDAKFVVMFSSLMNQLETVNKAKTANLMLSIPSSFLQLFEKHPELISSFFERLKQILMITAEDSEIVDLKRHAISLMLKVSSSMPNVIQNHAELIYNIVTTTASSLTIMQRANLVQVLGALSNLAQPNIRLSFLQSAIQANIDYFRSQTFINAISSVPNFMAFIGLTSQADPDEKTESVYYLKRIELKAHLCTIDGVLQHVNAPKNQSNPLFELLNPVLQTFFQLAHCLNALNDQSNQRLVHSSYDQSVTDISADDRHQIYCTVMEADDQEPTENKAFNATDRLRRYISDITDMVQSIEGLCGSKLFYDFYNLPNIQSFFQSCVMDLDLIIDFRLRYWIRRTWRPLILSCPIPKIVIPFATAVIQHMQQRLQNRWEAVKNVDYDEEQTKEEIYLEHMTCVLSREYVVFLKYIFLGDSNVLKDDSRKQPSELLMPSGAALFEDRTLLVNVIATLCTFLNCLDSHTMLKALPVAKVILGTTFNVLDEQVANFVLIQSIQSLQVHGADDVAKGPLLGLIFMIYTNLRPRFPLLRNVLQEIPDQTPDTVAAFDERVCGMALQEKILEKHRREVMHKFLKSVIAKNVGEQHKRPSHLRVLQPLLRPLKQNGENGSSGDISFETLFGNS
uniref:Exportin-1/Importin-beta-like domain-containing protein n=1 Tax=Panagrolaimus superbus TaxID=310955 RepID=A0A914Y819_9BILA